MVSLTYTYRHQDLWIGTHVHTYTGAIKRKKEEIIFPIMKQCPLLFSIVLRYCCKDNIFPGQIRNSDRNNFSPKIKSKSQIRGLTLELTKC